MSNEAYLKNEIERLKIKIQKLEERKDGLTNAKVRREVPGKMFDSDLGRNISYGTEYIMVDMPAEECKKIRSRLESEIREYNRQIEEIQKELARISYNKPENVEKREQQRVIEEEKERKKELDEKYENHQAPNKSLLTLIEYLELADMNDLARQLSDFAFKDKSHQFLQEEVELRIAYREFNTKTVTTRKEKREIDKSVKRLSKEASKKARKYKDLYTLSLAAYEIVQDIEDKGITMYRGDKLVELLKVYFNEPTAVYTIRVSNVKYKKEELENIGYNYLKFYRDYSSKYNQDVRNHRL